MALTACIPNNHPLDGQLEVITTANALIFAADLLDADGKPVLPRQEPFEKTVQLLMTADSQADHGAYVDVRIDPPTALTLVPVGDTCEQLEGAFRCTSGEDGFAQFKIRSDSDYSGPAKIKFPGFETASTDLKINPAGLPQGELDFRLVIEDVGAGTIPAKYLSLRCEYKPEENLDSYPAGKTRKREAQIRATPPSTNPAVVNHAPVIVESLTAEAFVTLDPTCSGIRTSRIRVQLDELGDSPKFYFCFSDIGGTEVKLSAKSGEQVAASESLNVITEPRFLRVITLSTTPLEALSGSQPVISVSAFNAALQNFSFKVDVVSDNPAVLKPKAPTAILPKDAELDEQIEAEPLTPGTARIEIRPELQSEPVCKSAEITVVEPPPVP